MMAVGKIREESVPIINYLNEVREGDVTDDQNVQRYFCSDNSFINGIGVTTLTGDYLPPIILGEIPLQDGIVQKYIVDAMQRTSALMKIRYGNYKFTSSIENDEIEYQTKVLDKNGKALKDEENNFIWEKKSFHLKGHTFDELPDELKKRFDRYQLRIVTHQNCTMDDISMLIRRYNTHKAMNSSQKALTWIPTYARQAKNIGEEGFFKNSMTYSGTDRKNGNYIQLVCNSVMALFHIDEFKKDSKSANAMLEEKSSHQEFETVRNILQRMEKCCRSSCKDVFVKKDISTWVVVFDKFSRLNLPDSKFAEFVQAIPTKLHNVKVGDWSYDLLYREPGTTGKKLVAQKIDTYTALMMDYLHITENQTENNSIDNVGLSEEITPLQFIRENISERVSEDDVDDYYTLMDDFKNLDGVNKESPFFDYHNELAFLGMIAYSFKSDKDLDDWLVAYTNKDISYSHDQVVNLDNMLADFKEFDKKLTQKLSA